MLKQLEPGLTVTIGLLKQSEKNIKEYITVKHCADFDPSAVKPQSDILCFDIETTTATDRTRSWMWIWQLCHNGTVYIGRTWAEWVNICNTLPKNTKIYVHNLSYEWAYLKDWFEWTNTLTRNERKIIAAKTKTGVEYRCTYMLTGQSLDSLAKSTAHITIGKQIGKLDYSKYRTPLTPITESELQYIVADVYIMWQYLHGLKHTNANRTNAEGKKIGGNNKIPYTKTGYVRSSIRTATRNDDEYIKYAKSQRMPYSIFEIYNKAYIGGDVHASEKYAKELHHTYNYDISSSYPYRMLVDEYPASSAIVARNPRTDIDVIANQKKLYVATIIIKNIRLKDWNHTPTISLSKCSRTQKVSESNGRVLKADYIEITLTSVDISILRANYNYDDYICTHLIYHDKKALLPLSYRKKIIEYYVKKTTLKGVDGAETEYQLNKSNVNSVYGMTVTSPIQHDMLYNNGNWTTDNKTDDEIYTETVYNDKKIAMPYTVGVWTTAFARLDLDNMRHKCRAVYWDTDSIKSLDDITDIIFWENERRAIQLQNIYNIDEYAPKDIYGRRHCIGIWDTEGETELIAWGSKKYGYYDKSGNPHITVAGCSKDGAVKWLSENHMRITDITDSTVVPSQYSGRMSAKYVDNLTPLTHADGAVTYDRSCVVLNPVDYTFDSTISFVDAVIMAQNNSLIGGQYIV